MESVLEKGQKGGFAVVVAESVVVCNNIGVVVCGAVVLGEKVVTGAFRVVEMIPYLVVV